MYNDKDVFFLATNWIWYNQFATKYSRILFWILTPHTQHVCFKLMFYRILYACVNSGAQAVSRTGNGLGTRLTTPPPSYGV